MRLSKKIISILIVLLIIGIIIVIYYMNNKGNKYKVYVENITNRNYFLVFNEKYGVIDEKGNIVVDLKYDEIQIPNPTKDVFICLNNYNSEIGNYETKVLNINGEEILTNYERIEAIIKEEPIDNIPFEKSVLKYKKNNKYGIVDFSGKQITKPIYDDIQALNYKDGMLVVKKDGKYGVINIKGEKLINIKYDTIKSDLYHTEGYNYQKSGFITSIKKGDSYKYGYIDCNGNQLLNEEYNEVIRINYTKDSNQNYLVAFKDEKAGLIKNKEIVLNYEYEDLQYDESNNIIIMQKDGKQGIANIEGNILIPIEYDNIIVAGNCVNAQKGERVELFDINGTPLKNKDFISIISTANDSYLITIDKNEKYGIIDIHDNVIFDNKYSYIDYLNNDYFIAKIDEFLGIIDKDGKEIIDFKYEDIQKIENTNLIECFNQENVEIINQNMESIVSMSDAIINIKQNYIIIYNENERKYFDYNGNELSNLEIFKENSLFAKQFNGKWGFVNKDGDIIIDYKYDMVTEVNEKGFAGIKKDGKWGIINSEGKIIKSPTYDIKGLNPDFIGEYYKAELGYGELLYTNK